MAISVEDTYPTRSSPASGNYPEGSVVNETVTGVSDDGTPLDELWGNDFEGVKQALMRSNGTVPTAPGNIPDTAVASQIMQGIVELASGRAFTYDDSGVADAYVLDVQTNQQAPSGIFDGQVLKFVPSNDNTGASTAAPFGLSAINIKRIGGTVDPIAGQIVSGLEATLIYRTSPSAHLELVIDDPHLVDEIIVSGGAVTQLDFTGLDINTHKGYLIVIEALNATAGTVNLAMYINGDTTATNYHIQAVTIDGGIISPVRSNGAGIGVIKASEYSTINAILSRNQNGVFTAEMGETRNDSSTVRSAFRSFTKNATVTNVDQVTVVADVANSLDNGTRIAIYRRDV